MNHIAEIAGGVALAVAAVAGALVVLPRPKPVPIVLEIEAKPVERAEPVREKSEAERVDELQKELGAIAAEHKQLTQDVKALVEREQAADSELKRTRPRK